MPIYQYTVTCIPSNSFSLLTPELRYTLSIDYSSPTKWQFSLKPRKSTTNFILLNSNTLIYHEKDVWHIDPTAAKDEANAPLNINTYINALSMSKPSEQSNPLLTTFYLSEKTDGLTLKFQNQLEKEAALKWLQLPPLTQDQLSKFKQKVQVKDRLFGFKTYKQCFVASDAVRWIVTIWNCSRMNAVWIGRRIQQEYKLFDHVTGEHLFKDRFLFFRFSDSGIRRESQNLFGSLYGGVYGVLDSTTRTVARHTGTDDLIDFATQIQDDARDIALDATTKGIENSLNFLHLIEQKAEKDIHLNDPALLEMTPSLVQLLSEKWNTEKTQLAMRLKAVETTQNLFPYPDSLKQLPLFVQNYEETTNALKHQLLSVMKLQIKQAQNARELIQNAKDYMKHNDVNFNMVQDMVKQTPEEIPNFQLIDSVQQTLSNMELTREWLQRMQDVNLEYVRLQLVIREEYETLGMKYSEELDEQDIEEAIAGDDSTIDLLEAHLRIRSLLEFKLKALLDLDSDSHLLKVFEDFFSIIDKLNEQFTKIITKHSQNIIFYASEGDHERVIEILRIIEREEQYEQELKEHVSDKRILQLYEWKNYRQLFFDSIRSSVKSTIRKEMSRMPLQQKLKVLGDSIEDLIYVKHYTRGLFPPHYNMMQFYVKTYEAEIRRFIEKRTSDLKSLSNADNSAIVSFLKEYPDLFDESILKYVDKLEDYSSLISSLNAQFVNNCSSKILDFSDNILKIVFSDEMRPIEYENSKYTNGPFDLLKTIQAQLEQARQRFAIAVPLIQQAIQVFRYFCSTFERKVREELDTISVYLLCLYINDFNLLNQFKDQIALQCSDILIEVEGSDDAEITELSETKKEKIASDWSALKQILLDHKASFLKQLVIIMGEELRKIPKAITKVDTEEFVAALREMNDFSADMEDVFSAQTFENCMCKIDEHICELIVDGLIVQEPDINDKLLELLKVGAQFLKRIFDDVSPKCQSGTMVQLFLDFLTKVDDDDGFSASATTGSILRKYPDVEKEVFASLLKNSKHIKQDHKKKMSMFILPYFESGYTPSKHTIFNKKYPKSMVPAPPPKEKSETVKQNAITEKIDAGTRLAESFFSMMAGSNTKKANNPASDGGSSGEESKKENESEKNATQAEDSPAQVVQISDVLGDEIQLPNLDSIFQEADNYYSSEDDDTSDDDSQ